MPITIRRSAERGHFDHGWLQTHHTFSFADYRDPRWVRFRSLRVINEDVVQPGRGFGTHPHDNMEILTWILSGALEHRDSMGNGSVIRPGDVQVMSAGTGLTHSEFNPSKAEPVHLLQIWILPAERDTAPRYQQQRVGKGALDGRLCKIAGPQRDADAIVTIRQDAAVYAARLAAGQSAAHALGAGRGAWLQLARGRVTLGDHELRAGDGAAVAAADRLELRALEDAELLLFDLA
jgi:hypothetical protein